MEELKDRVQKQDKEIRYLKGQIAALRYVIKTLYQNAKEQREISESILSELDKHEPGKDNTTT